MQTLFVVSFRYTTDIKNLIGGDTTFLTHLLPHLEKAADWEVVVLAPLYKGTAPRAHDGAVQVVRFPIKNSDELSLIQIHNLPEPEWLEVGTLFGTRAFDYICKNSKKGDVALLNDFLESGEVGKLKANGIKVIQICHVLLSEYIYHEYLADSFAGDREQLKKRFSPITLKLMGLVGRAIKSHQQLVKAFKFLISKNIISLLPKVMALPFQREHEAITKSDLIIAPTQAMREKLKNCYSVPDEKIKVIHWGVEPAPPRESIADEISALSNKYQITDQSLVITSMSRISTEKGIEFLIQALEILENENLELAKSIVVLIGGRPSMMRDQLYYDRLKKEASKLKSIKVHFIGFVTGVQKNVFLFLTDIFVLSSKHEPFGLSMLEAMSHGSAVIASDTDGPKDVVKPSFGKIVVYKKSEARGREIAHAIIELTQKDLSTLGHAAFLESQTYQWPKLARQMTEVINSEEI